jgi:hypothetical protein
MLACSAVHQLIFYYLTHLASYVRHGGMLLPQQGPPFYPFPILITTIRPMGSNDTGYFCMGMAKDWEGKGC